MPEDSRFFDLRDHTEAEFAEVLGDFLMDGVIRNRDAQAQGMLAVTAPGGMTVNVAVGRAMVQGFWYKNTATKGLAIAANASGSTRIDRVVLHLDRTANTIIAQIKQGTPGTGVGLALTRVIGGDYEICIAEVTVANGAATIIAGNLADKRNDYSLCGYTGDAPPELRLDYAYSGADINGVSMGAAGNAYTFPTQQTFRVEGVGSLVLITCRYAIAFAPPTTGWVNMYGMLDVSGSPQAAQFFRLGGCIIIAGTYGHPSGGVGVVRGLVQGIHTVRVDGVSEIAATVTYLLATSKNVYSFFSVQVLEIPLA